MTANFHLQSAGDRLSGEKRGLNFDDLDLDPHNKPFPLLVDVLTSIPTECAINVEIKYPEQKPVSDLPQLKLCLFTTHIKQDGKWVPECRPDDINIYIDTILEAVFRSAGKRQIVFTSFDPDTCSW